MKGLLLLSLVALVGCNSSDSNGNLGSGFVKQFEIQDATYTDKDNIAKLCYAVAFKSSTLSSQVGQAFNYSYAQKGCTGSLGTATDVNTILRSQNGQYFYDAPVAANFPFTQIDTLSTDFLQRLCANVMTLQNPIHMDDSGLNAIWYTTRDTEFCKTNSTVDEVCLVMDMGTSQGGISYPIHTSQIIKFKISNGDRRGHAIEKTTLSYSGCSKGYTQKTATLK